MTSNIQIDFNFLKNAYKEEGLFRFHPDILIFIYLVYIEEYKEANEWLSRCRLRVPDVLYSLESQEYIKIISKVSHEICEGILDFRPRFINLVAPINTKVNFDEFWDAFPTTTRTGRILRAVNKINAQGKATRDYETCKKKYLSKVKSEELHKQVVSIIKARIASGDYEYLNGMEIYINQCKWERDEVYLRKSKTINSINKMI